MRHSTLTAAQRLALELAQSEGWRVEVEARDGSRATLQRRQGWRTLVIGLAPEPAQEQQEIAHYGN